MNKLVFGEQKLVAAHNYGENEKRGTLAMWRLLSLQTKVQKEKQNIVSFSLVIQHFRSNSTIFWKNNNFNFSSILTLSSINFISIVAYF